MRMDARNNVRAGGAPTARLAAATFALFTFLLMGMGTWSDLALMGQDLALPVYYLRELMLAIGFVLTGLIIRGDGSQLWVRTHAVGMCAILGMSILACVVVLALPLPVPAMLRVTVSAASALFVGAVGALVYGSVARSAASAGSGGVRVLGLVVGAGGSAAVIVHYVLQIMLELGPWLVPVFAVCLAALMWCMVTGWGVLSPEVSPQPAVAAERGAVTLACMVVVAACLFGLLLLYEGVVRLAGAQASFYDWHRLFLVAGYLVVGGVAWRGGRPAATTLVVVSALFAILVLMQTALLQEGPMTGALFYTLLGAAIAWCAIMFMDQAASSSSPVLVAGAGRVIEAVVTVAGLAITGAGTPSVMVLLFSALVMLAVLVVASIKGGLLIFASHAAQAREEAGTVPLEERTHQLSQECGLTPREEDVLCALVLTEDKNQQIATDLGISRRQLQSHIAHIYKKTGAATRAGLVARASAGH